MDKGCAGSCRVNGLGPLKETLRQHLEQSCSHDELRQWFDPLGIAYEDTEKRLRVSFPHALFADWFTANMQARFEEQVSRLLGPGYVLDYDLPGAKGAHFFPVPSSKRTRTGLPYGHAFTFENFIVSKNNHFPFVSAREVAVKKDGSFNPLLLYGESGAGKTHLLKAIGNELAKTVDEKNIFYGNIEDIDFIYRRSGSDVFKTRQYLYTFHFLLIDDIQLLEDFVFIQNEFIALFDHFYNKKKQMIFCSTRDVEHIEMLHPKLQARLNWGLSVNLKGPDLESLIKYINIMCETKKIRLTKAQVLILAQRFRDFRSIQGILLKLFAFKSLVQKDIPEKTFLKIIDPTKDKDSARLEPGQILSVVADHYKIGVRDLTGKRRNKDIVTARQVAMYLCRELIGSSYPQLGRVFGGKDHSTVMHSVNKIKQLQAHNKDMKSVVTHLKKTCLSLNM